ncbi:MAG: hypothetical protein IT386_15260 [Deltaproteobacteria bacterium]|nr:hypothetical protein [Deltaproteobacteria bacterium]
MRFSRVLRGFTTLAALAVAAGAAHAQQPGREVAHATPVHVEVLIGYVSAQPGTIDPAAAELARMLGREFNLQTLRVLQLRQLSLALRQMGQVDLPTGHWVSVEPEEFTPRGLRMGVEVQGMLRTHVNVPSGNQVVIGAYSYEDGRLVVRLAPTYEAPQSLPEGR